MAMPAIIIVSVWKYMGYYMIVYLALCREFQKSFMKQPVLTEQQGMKKLKYITIPMLKPTTFFVVIMLTIQCFKVFDLIYIMTGGGPGRATQVMVNHIYDAAFTNFEFGYASASAIVLFAIVLCNTLVQFRGEKKFTEWM